MPAMLRSYYRSVFTFTLCVFGACNFGTQASSDLANPAEDMASPLDSAGAPDLAGAGSLLLFTVTPRLAPSSGGVKATIFGQGFVAGASLKVEVNGVPATQVTVDSPGQLTVTLPALPGVVGAVPVKVTNGNGAAATLLGPELFTVFLSNVSYAAATSFAVGVGPRSVVATDFDGDQKIDLAVACADGNRVGVMLGQGNGSFGNPKYTTVGTYPFTVASADFDGNGKPDLVTSNQGSNNVSVLFNYAADLFGTSKTFAVGSKPQGIALGDVNEDGKPDVVIGNYGSSSYTLLTNQGQTNFGSATSALTAAPYAMLLEDVTADTHVDLCSVSDVTGSFYYGQGNGTGSFVMATAVPVGAGPYAAVYTDLNLDGYPEIIAANPAANKLSLQQGQNGTVFSGPTDIAVGMRPEHLATADLDGDRYPDLVVANYNSNTVTILYGKGDTTFGRIQTVAVGTNPNWVTIADVNGDKRLDIVAANYKGDSVSVLLNSSQ